MSADLNVNKDINTTIRHIWMKRVITEWKCTGNPTEVIKWLWTTSWLHTKTLCVFTYTRTYTSYKLFQFWVPGLHALCCTESLCRQCCKNVNMLCTREFQKLDNMQGAPGSAAWNATAESANLLFHQPNKLWSTIHTLIHNCKDPMSSRQILASRALAVWLRQHFMCQNCRWVGCMNLCLIFKAWIHRPWCASWSHTMIQQCRTCFWWACGVHFWMGDFCVIRCLLVDANMSARLEAWGVD